MYLICKFEKYSIEMKYLKTIIHFSNIHTIPFMGTFDFCIIEIKCTNIHIFFTHIYTEILST